MMKKTGLACVLATMACLTSSFANAADDGEAQQATPKSDVEKQPEKPPTPKEETANTNSTQSDSAKPKEDPNCE